MTFTITTIFFIVFSGLLFLTLFGFVLVVVENDRDIIEQLSEEKILNKEQNKIRRIEKIAKAAAKFTTVNDVE